ncbi:hypothetical protein HYS54_03565 [Candidatus Micrarchaeota archaeon]|nr:hypothetical protein [Candidatus Micrarchaeota archaeon]
MADLWSDVRLALTLIVFLYLAKWTIDIGGGKKTGIIIAAVIAFLTFYSHWELLALVVVFFFAYPFFDEAAKVFEPGK